MTILTAQELGDAMARPSKPLLMHVLPEEHFLACHLAGALNVCSYESAFLDQVRELAPASDTPLVVYGEGAPSLDSEDAAAKLIEAGYTKVADFRGGLREWRAAGLAVESCSSLPSAPLLDGRFEVDVATSVIRWTGQNLFNHHEGSLKLAAGSVVLSNGGLEAGDFTIDMNSVVCSDLEDTSLNAMLIAHLRTADFFHVDAFPTAGFVMRSATPIANAAEGSSNYRVAGDFTLRGTTRELSFPAVVAAADAGNVTVQAHVQLDRTWFGSHYGSGRFFAFLGKHVVNDLIQLHLKIHAVKM